MYDCRIGKSRPESRALTIPRQISDSARMGGKEPEGPQKNSLRRAAAHAPGVHRCRRKICEKRAHQAPGRNPLRTTMGTATKLWVLAEFMTSRIIDMPPEWGPSHRSRIERNLAGSLLHNRATRSDAWSDAKIVKVPGSSSSGRKARVKPEKN